jgi:hypothetical protein
MRRFVTIPDAWPAVLAAAVLLGITWLVCGVQLSTLDERARADTTTRSAEVGSAYAADVSSTFQLVADVLRFVAAYDADNGIRRTADLVTKNHLYSGLIGNMAIVDMKGKGLSIGPRGLLPIDISDRPHFSAARRANGAMVIGRAFKADRTGNFQAVPFSLQVRRVDGTPAGVVSVAIDNKAFGFGYSAEDVGANGTLAMVGSQDRVVRTRITFNAHSEGVIGRIWPAGSALWHALVKSPNGSYWQASIVDRKLRAYTYHKLPAYPIVVVIGYALQDILTHTLELVGDEFIQAEFL